MKHDTHAYVSC